jgi:ABC-2 type transport system ATP-binding protein
VPTTGSAAVAGHDATTQSLALRHEVGYVPEDAPLYDHMRVIEHLKFMANLKGLFGHSAARAIGNVAERLQLRSMADVPIGKLSRGYRQRVAIGQALLNDPKLLIFDEPTSGLDPSQVIAIRDLIRELSGKRTILMASHVLPEIEQIANRVMILLNGRLLTTDALAVAVDSQRLRLQVAGPEPLVRDAIAAVPGVRSIVVEPQSGGRNPHYLVEADQRSGVAQEIAAALVGRGLALSELTTVRPDLERTFLQLTRQPGEAAA